MFDFIKKYKNITFGIVVIVLGFFAYTYFWSGGRAPELPLLTSERSDIAAGTVGADILALLRDLRSITLDQSFFEDPVFRGLQDFGQSLTPEPVGRSNPFAPVGEE